MEQPPTLPVSPGNAPTAPGMSLAARLLNVFAVPSEVFTDVKTSPSRGSNWAIPMVLLALVGAISAVLMFSQPALLQQVKEQQAKAFDAKIKEGKLRQEDADKIEQMMTPRVVATSAGVVVSVISALKVLWWGLVLWLLAKWCLKTAVPFSKTMEVAGLVMMIVVLGSIVTLLLTINLSRLGATPSLALMVKDLDFTRKSHVMMGAANVFNFWQVALMALGLARLAGVPFARAAMLVFSYWVLQESALILIGAGQFAL